MAGTEMRSAATAIWWLVLIRGALAVLFGLFALFAPATALLALVFVFATYAVLDGVVAVVAGIRHRRDESHWVWQVVQGIVSVIAGVIAFLLPGVTVAALLFVVAIWSLIGGIAEIAEAFTMRRQGSATWGWMLAAGILGVLFGVVLLVQPGAALVTLLWLVGVWAVVSGITIIVWAFRLRSTVRAAAGP